jgi:integrase
MAGFNMQEVYQVLYTLETKEPTVYRMAHAIGRPVNKAILEQPVVDALQKACCSARETLVFLLLSTVGLRASAVHNLLVRDVYDVDSDTAYHTCSILEKNSAVRQVRLTDQLRLALMSYIKSCAPKRLRQPGALLFHNARHPMVPYSSLCRHTCAVLCKRAGVHHVHPHQFRTYIVNTCIENGNSLEVVSKWLGHKSVSVTYRHYFSSSPMTLDELIQQGGNRKANGP